MDETDFTLLQAGWDDDTISVYRQGLFYVYMWRNAGLPWDETNAWGGERRQFSHRVIVDEKDRKVPGLEVF